ncbi:helix-turn-helix domain-containing protein [Amycolatopsis pithecellobii]|uniref:Helix-turn-helix domain-containing protein n=1 Tax=Amycolatopsis pithecellobii TaxID=664692 RepID=A0A6N7Z304_9PSEU|nr:helix-turn-helix domain-containing protein [Amycolatopsis pithecellobii]MTD55399.1 helix-turn-helix domain-containing protein [Amycolatopsis pithecellobii]
MTDQSESRFCAELRRLLKRYKLTQVRLAKETGYSTAYVSKLINGQQLPSDDVAKNFDRFLKTGGTLWQVVQEDRNLAQYAVAPPAQPKNGSCLVGRGPELNLLDMADAQRRKIFVTGDRGIGKTAFVTEVHHLQRGHFPGGSVYLDLDDPENLLPRELVLVGGLKDLGIPERALADLAQENGLPSAEKLLRLVNRIITEKAVLCVLNGAPVEWITALNPGARSLLVASTSEPVPDLSDVTVIELGPLAPAEARTLLAHVAGEMRVMLDPKGADLLAERCGYNPLFLVLAGKRLAADPGLTIRELVRRMEQEGE